jgi:hypothetical protein
MACVLLLVDPGSNGCRLCHRPIPLFGAVASCSWSPVLSSHLLEGNNFWTLQLFNCKEAHIHSKAKIQVHKSLESWLFRFLPSLPLSSQVPSPQASEIRSIRRLSPRTETSYLDLFLQSSDYFPNRMFCPGLSIIRPDRFPEISVFVTSCKFSICKEINCEVPSPQLLGLSSIFNFWT